jgi:hypothetical protein
MKTEPRLITALIMVLITGGVFVGNYERSGPIWLRLLLQISGLIFLGGGVLALLDWLAYRLSLRFWDLRRSMAVTRESELLCQARHFSTRELEQLLNSPKKDIEGKYKVDSGG